MFISSNEILQINPYTLSFKIWNSTHQAALKLNINQNDILKVINNNRNHAGGYYWKRYDEFVKTVNGEEYLYSTNRIEPEQLSKIYNPDSTDTHFKLNFNPFLINFNMYGYMHPCFIPLPGEIWKDIEGYINDYRVSNYGNVINIKKLPYIYKLKNEFDTRGYYRVNLSKNSVVNHYTVHRLVLEAFVPNPDNLPCINHKDENPLNNHIDNLEWCTQKYNMNYGTCIERISKSQKTCTIVEKINLLTRIPICEYWSQGEASRITNINQSKISDVCRGYRKSAGGFGWRFKNEKENVI